MNFFKKALIATAVAGTFGTVQAADLTDAVTKTSAQGLEIATAAAQSSIRVIVREQLEAGDQITLVFGKGVTGITSVEVDANGDAVTTTNDNALGLIYGSGTFKLRPMSVTTVSGVTTVVVEVATGDPITLDSSFEVEVRGANLDKTKVAETSVTYSAISSLTGLAKDTTGDNTGLLIVTADQYASSVKVELDGVIERLAQKTFKENGIGSTNTDADNLVLTLADNQALLSAAVGTAVEATVTLKGDFGNNSAVISLVAAGTGSATTGTASFGAFSIAGDEKSASFTLTGGSLAGDYDLLVDNTLTGTDKILASDFTVSIEVDADLTTGSNTVLETDINTDAGQWKIDAAIINVPYFVVGKEGTASSVHFSNLGPLADVIVEAVSVIDAAGDSVVYPATDLGFDLAANSVTKVSQGAIISALGIPAGTQKLSVTFNIDGKSTDVSAYAFTQTPEGRSEISNSQQK